MAIPFFEPKTTTPSNNNYNNSNQNNAHNSNNQINDVASPILQYDQVDGHAMFTQPVMTTTAITSTSTPTATSTTPEGVLPSETITLSNNTTATIPIPTSTSSTSSSSTSTIEQQSIAWKILALAMCKALKEYYLQTASSKDAFTNQTVQVLPNGEVQPLWK